MATYKFKDNSSTTLSADIATTGTTSITVTDGTQLPTTTGGQFDINVYDGINVEVMTVTNNPFTTPATLTVVRNSNGAGVHTFLAATPTTVENDWTANAANNSVQISPTSAQSGNINMNGTVTGTQLISSIATGTPPFSVASATVVPNLNVSQLGGLSVTALDPMTTTGDIMYASDTATPANIARLGIGATNYELLVISGLPSWQPSPTSTLTTTGDMLYASSANTLGRLAIGATGTILVGGTTPSWTTSPVLTGTLNIGNNTLSSASTALTVNPAVGHTGSLLDIQRGGTSYFSVLNGGATTGVVVNQADYFYSNVVSGLALSGTTTITAAAGIAYVNGVRYNVAATTISATTANGTYFVRLNPATAALSLQLVATAGTTQLAATGLITLGTAAITTNSVTAFVDLRQAAMANTPITSLTSQSSGVLVGPPAGAVPTVTATGTAGALSAGAYVWAYTYVTANGETAPSLNTAPLTVSATNTATVTVTAGPTGTLARRIYRSKVGTTAPLYHCGTIPDNTTLTLADALADTSLVTPCPTLVDSVDTTQTSGHIHNSGRAVPTIAVTAGTSNAGTGATSSFATASTTIPNSTDTRGQILISTGTGTVVSGSTWATVTFGTAYSTPPVVILTRADALAGNANVPLAISVSTTGFVISGSATTISSAYKYNYWVIG